MLFKKCNKVGVSRKIMSTIRGAKKLVGPIRMVQMMIPEGQQGVYQMKNAHKVGKSVNTPPPVMMFDPSMFPALYNSMKREILKKYKSKTQRKRNPEKI